MMFDVVIIVASVYVCGVVVLRLVNCPTTPNLPLKIKLNVKPVDLHQIAVEERSLRYLTRRKGKNEISLGN
jgi:hypothetical protein